MKTAKPKPNPELEAYEAWYDEQIRLGLQDLDAGRVVSHEEAMRQMDTHMKKLAKKHAPKAA